MSDAALVQAIAAYVPSSLVRQVLSGAPPVPGELSASEAVVLFADISGFTPMSEALSRVGRQGAEQMNQHLNTTFSATIARIAAHGGEVAAFGGDAILAFFSQQTDETAMNVAWRALSCAQAMREAMTAFEHIQTLAGPFSLRMKYGLSRGRIIVVNVGSPETGLEFVIAGACVDQAVNNENFAESGQIIADDSVLAPLTDRIVITPIGRGVARVEAVEAAPIRARPAIDYANLDPRQRQIVLDAIAPYLPTQLFEDLVAKGSFVGDHRPITNLFVYFSGLDYDHDPDVGHKLETFVLRAQEIIHRYDGTLNRVLTGDKGSQMHILFGAPVAHEDDKARALRCALKLRDELSALPFIAAQRIGMASGYVFAGPVGAVAHLAHAETEKWPAVTRSEYTVMGDIVNLSARLTGVCPPGQIIADPYTRSRTAQRFEFRSFGPVKLKGKSQPVTPYLVEGERAAENTLVTRYLLSERPLVGRRQECTIIERIVDQAIHGQGQVLAVTGPAGVGKSRLVEEAVRRWLRAAGVGYGGDCVSHGSEIPYLPWADLWRAQFDLHENDTPHERQAKILHTGQKLGLALDEWAALAAGLLGLPGREDEHPALATLDAQARQRRLLALTADLVTAQARHAPTLLLFEDLHWADRASLELIDYVAERVAGLPVLICLAYRPRPDLNLSCLIQSFCQTVVLGELSEEDGAALVRSMLGNVDLPTAFLHLVHAKAQGNPLFVEELVNGLVDVGLLVPENGSYHVTGDLAGIQIPDTIEAVLLARIDRLAAPNRDVLRVASVIGRQFGFGVLRGIYPYPMIETEMLDRLTYLERMDLTRLERPDPELEYLFKHALTQEVAYANLPFAQRRDLHQRIGRFLEQHYRDHLETLYGTLAHHFAEGGQADKALFYALAAGEQAQALFANPEALAHYAQAERLLVQLPPEGHVNEAMRLYLNRGDLHTLLGNFDQAEADLQHALSLSETYHDRQAQALNHLAHLRYWQARNEEMLQLAQQALALAEAENHTREIMMALHRAAMAQVELGQYPEATAAFLRARTLAEALDDRRTLSSIHMGIAVAAFSQGQFRDALAALQQLLILYRESGDKDRTSNCLSNIANIQFYLGDLNGARAAFEESIAIDREIGKRAGLAYGLCDWGALHCHCGDYAAGLAAMNEAIAIFDEIDDQAGRAYGELALGRHYYLDAGEGDAAQRLLSHALAVFQDGESHEETTEALLALGQLSLRRGDYAQAHTEFSQALTLCQDRSLRWRLPEATVRMAELALARGDHVQAAARVQETLTAIASGGCPDFASAAHLVLAHLADEPLPYYEQALEAARQHGRRIDLARTLVAVGRYLRDRSEADLRTQGQAYLNEAQAISDGLHLPPNSSSS
jgi:predicted ATPase/class 3 adenylate cyclase